MVKTFTPQKHQARVVEFEIALTDSTEDLASQTKTALTKLAKERDVAIPAGANKAQIVAALAAAGGGTETYRFTTQPVGPVMAGATADTNVTDADIWAWLRRGLGDKQAARLHARMADPADDFDYEDFKEVLAHLVAESAKRPTRRR